MSHIPPLSRIRQPFLLQRQLLPAALVFVGLGTLAAWSLLNPQTLAVQYVRSSHHATLLGSGAIEAFEALHLSLRNVGLLALALAPLAALLSWLRPRLLGAAAVFAFSAVAYALSSGPFLAQQSDAPHFVYLADALAHGRVYLDSEPPYSEEGDWTYFDGRWMVSFPPLPALLMIPFVALVGKGFNDVMFTLVFGALNVALVYDLSPRIGQRLARGFAMDRKTRIAVTLLFGFGTVHWWVACVGQVWFTAQIVALTFLLLALDESLGRGRPLLVGAWLALAALGRPPMLLALPFFLWLLAPKHPPRRLLTGLIPMVLAGGFMAWYDFARFGNPIELGYRYMRIERLLEGPMLEHGEFSLAFLAKNLYYAFVALPQWSGRWPFLVFSEWGLSMFVSTPALVYLFAAPWREALARANAVAALLVASPSLLYYNTGYMQAGYRFILDFIPFLFALVVMGMRGRLTKLSGFLILLSLGMGFLSLVNFYIMVFG